MHKFYIASSLSNIEKVREVSKRLKDKGFIHTYDWTKNERAATLEDLKEIGEKELVAVLEADFLIVLLPGGKGSHIEFGIALGQGKKIFLYSENDDINNVETTSTFYHLDNVEKVMGTVEELLERVDLKKE
ncbi:MAG: nucleoside 2-deoxyribosyltransferase [Bacillota bacterium]|uniref:nucleoside 2-deoxyribosyltransferase n=1 Tax=Bacillus sp. RO2 TaxID=2723913 RepID=UPI00145C8595|nr:nucleoside 2-deoxyribosyltransferase [Bacillus sp. RO2]MEA3319659.1 nucleoside 2-deoxyribosyltransferase [Bacillota bacterium]NMH71670.1 group-specific protein [Bacillus sp. RO2]